MKQLIRITEEGGKKAVSARELHAFLESKRDFSNWINDRIKKYGLIENEDFASFNKNVEREKGGSTRIEYALSIDCAKELSMVEGNAKGARVMELEDRVRRLEANRVTSEVNEFTVHGYAGLTRKKLYGSEAMMIGKRAAKRCKEEGLPVNTAHDFRFGMVNVYPEVVLRVVFEEFFSKARF